jgi:malate dehydrogenase (oxaloacetate-decarboxylating)
VLAFPGIFRGAFDAKAKQITETMKLAASDAIAALALDVLDAEHLLPEPFNLRLGLAVAEAVAGCAGQSEIA